MKKQILVIFVAVLAASFVSAGYAAPKRPVKKPVPSKNVVLLKNLQIDFCGKTVKDNGSITVHALKNGVKIPVVKGKFNLTLPSKPVFGDEMELSQARGDGEEVIDFGNAKVYILKVVYFENKSKVTDESEEYRAQGRGVLRFQLYFSDVAVTGTVNGEEVKLKKGWNIVGGRTNGEREFLTVSLMCTG